jgi:hypothetical protein
MALGAGRVTIGAVALVRPDLMARALGIGALLASSRRNARGLLGWTVAGSFCDAVDVAATLASWRNLPSRGRWAIAGAATSGVLLGALTVVLARRG